LLVTEPAGFEAFTRARAEPAQALTLPPPGDPHPEQMTAIAAEYGIDILGPPGIPASKAESRTDTEAVTSACRPRRRQRG
jgi:hypothetical protein